RMEKRGLVRRRQSATSKKLKKVDILPKGREALDQIVQNDNLPILMEMSDDEFRELWQILERLKDRVLSRTKPRPRSSFLSVKKPET
ncbi:MAG: hypothetical protein NTU41_13910, partial [Chloroflexi bacterium]|nr:hypothetical protein [Chloroflexota bacterium]